MKIGVINTGGTISCVGDPLSPMSAEAFAKASESILNPILKQRFPDVELTYLTSVVFPESSTKTLDSTNLQPSDWCIMARAVLANYAGFDGFVILHGTDSMDFTGAALPFLLNAFDTDGCGTAVLSKPVIITGSQVPMYYQSSPSAELSLNFNTDAFQNVCGSVAAARTGVPEVCVYFENHLYRGNRVLKTNASEFNAFSSPNYPALAEYGVALTLYGENWLPGPVHSRASLDNPDVLVRQQQSVVAIERTIDDFPVMQFNAFPAHYSMSPATSFIADLIGAAVNAGAKGIILESYGEGNFPSGNPDRPTEGAICKALADATEKGINVVDCTQVITGTVNNSAYASGAWLPEAGALAPADMSPMAALAKLMILMTLAGPNQWSRAQVRTLFQTNLAGEMLSVNTLDSRTNATLLPGQSIAALDGSATLTNDQALGPVLRQAGTEQPLWRAMEKVTDDELPGRLVMQDDGNLVFYSRFNRALWATNTGEPAGASSKLRLTGTYDARQPGDCTLRLEVYDYSDDKVSAVLFTASQPVRAAA